MYLNQYYTEHTYSDVLVHNLSIDLPKIALDLGFGKGNLLHAAKRRWKSLNLVGVDIDERNVNDAQSQKLIHALPFDGLNPDLPNIINDRFGDIDLLVSNPPYFSSDFDKNSKQILNSIGLLDCVSKNLKKVPAELIFLAQNLRLLSQNGELGIIVPAGLISGQRWHPVREFLFSNYVISNVIQLPTNSFKQTDAQTFILTIKHKVDAYESTSLSHINKLKILNVALIDAMDRADYNYYNELSSLSNEGKLSISDFDLYRGNKSHIELSKITNKYLHSTSMPELFTRKVLTGPPMNGAKNTQPGDILITRVGRRCLGRTLYVDKGTIPISDCIIAVRPKTSQIGEKIWEKLSSPECRKYLVNASLGVSAKYITYKTITDYLTDHQNAIT